MFNTENIEFCLIRAETRFKNGGHLVKPEIVSEMFKETIPLLKANLTIFTTFRFVNISNTEIEEVSPNKIPNYLKEEDLAKLIS